MNESAMYKKAAILGPGLIGGSVGLVLKRSRLAAHVVGFARRDATLSAAREIGAVDEGTRVLKEALSGADLVFLAVPVEAAIQLIEEAGRLVSILSRERRPLVTDACSTKVEVVEAARRFLPRDVDFVGGHPMAGSEASGPEHAREDLFGGASWVLTPDASVRDEAVAAVGDIVNAAGAKEVRLTPEVHDEIVALVSHMPHLLSVVLTNQAGEAAESRSEIWCIAASGFRDMTRLAAGNPELWADICATNAGNIAAALGEYRRRLEEVEQQVRQGNRERLAEMLIKAQNLRSNI